MAAATGATAITAALANHQFGPGLNFPSVEPDPEAPSESWGHSSTAD